MADFVHFCVPYIGICKQLALRSIPKSLGYAEYGNFGRNFRENKISEPINAEARHAADYHISTAYSLLHFFNLVILNARGEITVEFRVTVGGSACVDYSSVERSSDESYLVSVFSCGKRESRTHHSRSDYSYRCHFSLLIKILI